MAGLHEEYDRLRAERDGLVDRLARLQAEFDNARKREQRERADYRAFAVADAVEQFLPVLDNFKLALNATGYGGAVAHRRGTDRKADGRRAAVAECDAGGDGGAPL